MGHVRETRVTGDHEQDHAVSGWSSGIRWRSGIGILLVGLAGVVLAAVLAPDSTLRVMAVMNVVGGTIWVLTAWWLFFSGVPLRWRLGGWLMGATLLTVAVAATVRDIWFDGDMTPRFHWRWQPRRADLTAEWLRQNAPATTVLNAESARTEVSDSDWSRYCGLHGARRIPEPKPAQLDWDQTPPRELWRHPVGEGWSSFSVVGSFLLTQEQRGPLECVVCYDAESGREAWRHEDEARYETAMGGIGPRATPSITSEAVFALGATGLLNCLNPATGRLIWQHNIVEDSGGEVLDWGMSGSPLLYGNLVIVDAGGGQGRAVIAYEQTTGSTLWAVENHKAGYAAPRLEQIGGQLQLLIFHGDGLLSLNPESGERLWQYPWTNLYNINVAQPLRFGDHIFISSGYDAGCVLLDPTRLRGGLPREVWPPAKSLKLKFNEAVQRENFVYGLDDGILSCVDARTGDRKWKGGRYRFGQVLLWDDLLLIQAEKGYVAIVAATPDEFREITRFDALSDRTWNVPVVNRGRLYVRNASEAACFQVSE